MQISNSFGQTTPLGSSSRPDVGNKFSADAKKSVPVIDPNEDKQQSANNQSKPIVLDEQAIALFQENQKSQSNSKEFSSAGQDQPLAKNETAVASYQAIDNLAQRESVQELFGVDLFA